MSVYRYDIQQNTDLWVITKLGKFSSSTAHMLLSEKERVGRCPVHNKGISKKDEDNYTCGCGIKFRDSEDYRRLIKKIIEERITGNPCESKWNGNYYTDRGLKFEDDAADNFELSTFTKTHKIGLVEMNDWVVSSPDRLIGDKRLLQIKCPIFSTQLDYLEIKGIPTNYYKQMQFELMVTERESNIFYSYCPPLPSIQIETNRDETLIKEIQDKLVIAINEVQDRIEQIRSN